MARKLVFDLGGEEIPFEVYALKREKLYGAKEKEFLDQEGRRCVVGSVTADGLHVLVSGSTATGYIGPGGVWIPRKELTPVDEEGKPLERVQSSFKEKIELEEKASVEEYLDRQATKAYQLVPRDEAGETLLETVRALAGKGRLFRFRFASTAGYRPEEGFLVENDGVLFLVAGKPLKPEYSEFEAPVEEREAVEEEEGGIDFEMF